MKMYTHTYLDPDLDAHSFQQKVQFDIRFFFSRRGCKNMETMKVDDFALQFDTKTESWYVKKIKDELTKNHRAPENIITGFIPENKDDRLCPVRSFRMYLEHLEPSNDYLWQVPLRKLKPNSKVWYGKQHYGKNTLAPFMKEISKQCELSMIYHNHSIHVTGITVLTRQQFSNSEIMSVTRHKSVQSLTVYQHTEKKQKLDMGNVLFQSVTRKEEDIVRPANKDPLVPKRKEIEYNAKLTLPQLTPSRQDKIAVTKKILLKK